MASWIKMIMLGVGVAGALYGAVKIMLSIEATPQEYGPRRTPRRRNSSSNESNREASQRQLRECEVCSEKVRDMVVFFPCSHAVTCTSCGSIMKKCIKCKRQIANRITEGGRSISYHNPSSICPSSMEDSLCSICYENKKGVVFTCGHTACPDCSNKLVDCHLCRSAITSRRRFY